MIFELPQTLSGITASSGQLLALNDLFSGLTISLGQITINYQLISGISICQGQIIQNISPKIIPNLFTLLFGVNALQNTNFLVIDKNDLTDLTPNNDNTAESLLVGLLYRNLINNTKIQTPIVDFKYWGYGYNGNKKIDTIIISFYNLLPIANTYEIASYSNTVTPNNY